MRSTEVATVDYVMDGEAEARLVAFFDRVGGTLGNAKRRASFAIYATGLLGSAERKSMEPIAALASADEATVDALHQRLGHFLTDSAWSDREVRKTAAEHAVSTMLAREPIEHWILDDTGFLKQGKHSVGVQRQYTGTAGKIANCQIGVSLSVSTRTEHLPIDFELYLPQSWTEDAARRKEARIPDSVEFKTKPELALQMIDRALEDGVPPGVVLADEAYGTSDDFRHALRERGLDYAVSINGSTTFWSVDRNGKVIGRVSWSAKELAEILGPKAFRRTTWREGTSCRLSARFAARRVIAAHDDGRPISEREVQWLLMEWRDGEEEPAHFHLLTLPPETTRKELVRVVKERWRTERAYEDLKGELGLDHFEGRRYSGWHHHVSVALACYAFITAERVSAFFPSAERKGEADPNSSETRATLSRVVHHSEAGDCSCSHAVAPPMPDLPPEQWPTTNLPSASAHQMTQ
jgi:SRSO17 transposase